MKLILNSLCVLIVFLQSGCEKSESELAKFDSFIGSKFGEKYGFTWEEYDLFNDGNGFTKDIACAKSSDGVVVGVRLTSLKACSMSEVDQENEACSIIGALERKYDIEFDYKDEMPKWKKYTYRIASEGIFIELKYRHSVKDVGAGFMHLTFENQRSVKSKDGIRPHLVYSSDMADLIEEKKIKK